MSAPEPRSRFWDFNIGHVIMLLAMFGSLQYWGGGLVAKITTMQSDIDRNKLDIVEERAARAEAATQAAAQAREASADALQWRNEIDTKLEGLNRYMERMDIKIDNLQQAAQSAVPPAEVPPRIISRHGG